MPKRGIAGLSERTETTISLSEIRAKSSEQIHYFDEGDVLVFRSGSNGLRETGAREQDKRALAAGRPITPRAW